MRTTTALVLVSSVLAVSACSGDDSSRAPVVADDSVATTGPQSGGVASSEPSALPSASTTAAPDVDASSTAATFAVVEVPETGVPGLDSDDSFCAAWSRFGGSWQVIQVAANFAPDPAIVPAMEVVAARVVEDAYAAMFEAWPEELVSERDLVADGYFGPLARRAEAALEALDRVDATEEQVDELGRAWVDALAERRPDDPTLTPVLTDDLWALVDAAAAELSSQRVDFLDDPSMRITVETPLTDAYLATACPDQGSLTGAEVDGG